MKNVRKKSAELVLFLALLIGAIAAFCSTADAATSYTSGYYTYTVSSREATITGCDTSISGSVTIPLTLGGFPVTSIGNEAFSGCSGLTSVTIPNSVTSMGYASFNGCSGLRSISLPFVGREPHASNDTYYNYPFGYIFGTSSYTGGSATEQRYYGSSSELTYSTFYIPSALKTVTITGSSYIPQYAFYNCSGLKSITIPNSVTSIGSSAFSGCSGLTSISVDANNASYCSMDGVLFNKDITTLLCFPKSKTDTSYTIPDSVTSIADGAFSGCSRLMNVTIGSDVMSIGEYAFSGCSGLTSVTLPNSVTSIGDYAFSNCTGLTSITIPDSVTSIANDMFYGCSGMTSVTIGSGVTSIGSGAFQNCSGLTSVTIPDTVTSIGKYAFYHCSGLTSISLPFVGDKPYTATDVLRNSFAYIFGGDSSTNYNDIPSALKTVIITGSNYIPSGAFSKCNGIRSVTIVGNGVTSIGSDAFYGCSGLTSVTIGSGVTSIGSWAFSNCTGLTSITIPDSVTSIGWGAFYGCSGLTSVTIPDSVTSINGSAFSGCSGLTSVTIPNSVTSIGSDAFKDCSGLTSVTIGSGVTSIGSDAFKDCSRLSEVQITDLAAWCKISFGNNANPLSYAHYLYLDGSQITDLVIPDSVTSIGNYAFSGCDGLTSVTIPDSVTSIGYEAFYDCDGLTSVTIPNSVTSIGNYAFCGCSGLTSVTIGSGVTDIGIGVFSVTALYNDASNWENDVLYIGDCLIRAQSGISGEYVVKSGTRVIAGAFSGCSGLTSVTIPDSVTSIGEYAFQNCSGLTSVTIPDSVTSIGSDAFKGCSGLTSVTIGSGVTSIGSDAFKDCSRLSEVQITDLAAWCKISFGYNANPLSYAQNLHLNGSKITDLVIPAGVSSIGNYAFYNCTGLTSVMFGVSVTSIGYAAFYGCSGLTSVTIPDSVTSIGSDAFKDCSGLTSVTIGSGVTSIGYEAFYDCDGLTSVTIPDSVTSIGSAAFSGCSGLTSISLPFVGYKPHAATDAYQYPFGYIFGTSSYSGGTATKQYYYGSSTSSMTYDTYYIPSALKSVTITGSGYIPHGAFYNCSGISSITIGDGVTGIGRDAFYNSGIYNDASNWENSALYIDHCLIAAGTDLTGEYAVQSGTRLIAGGAFSGCSGLTSVTIPDSVTSIGEYAFQNCSGLTSVKIPDNVTSIGSCAFYKCSGLTSVTIPDNVTSIGNHAFYYCSGLTSVTIPDNVTSIGNHAFYYCSGLTSVTIPDKVTSIGNYAFYYCSGLTSITIPDSMTSIGDYAFLGSSSLYCRFLGDAPTLGTYAFPGGTVLAHYSTTAGWTHPTYQGYICKPLDLPEAYDAGQLDENNRNFQGVLFTLDTGTAIVGDDSDDAGFTGYSALVIPETVTDRDGNTYEVVGIGKNAFRNNVYVETVQIPQTIRSIGANAFFGCKCLEAFAVDPANANYSSDAAGVLYDKSQTQLLCYPGASKTETYAVAPTVSSIAARSFYGVRYLQELTIPFVGLSMSTEASADTLFGAIFGTASYPGGVGRTQYYASSSSMTFYIPSCLQKVTVTGGTLNYGAFYNCGDLREIVLENAVTAIGDAALENCTSLENLVIPENVESVQGGALYGCGSLRSLTMPVLGTNNSDDGVLGYIFGTKPFSGCVAARHDYATYYIPSALETVIISKGDLHYGEFSNCWKIRSITLPEGAAIDGHAFSGCQSLETITIPGGFADIPEGAFEYCYSLDSVLLSDRCTAIGAYGFRNCTALTGLVIPEECANVGTYAFYNCRALRTINIPDGITSIAPYTFYGCAALTGLSIPTDCADIGSYAFYHCESLQTVNIPSGVTSIEPNTFNGCAALTSITIPNLVSQIGNFAFYGCTSLGEVEIPGSVSQIGNYAFSGCSGLTSVQILDGVSQIGNYAFSGCTGLAEVKIPGSVSQFGSNLLAGCAGLTSVRILDGVSQIGDYAFSGCTGLAEVEIPGSVTQIGSYAFNDCTGLTSFVVPDTVTNLGNYAFAGCTGLTEFSFNSTMTNIPEGVLTGCAGLETISLPKGVVKINTAAFQDCSGLTLIVIPNSVTSVENNAFNGCAALSVVNYLGEMAQWNSISIGSGNTELTKAKRYYNGHTVTIRYVDWQGNELFETVEQMWSEGDTYSHTSPELEYFLPDQEVVTGVMPGFNLNFTVTYYENVIIGSGTCGNLNWKLYENGDLFIKGEGAIPNYADGGAPWYELADQVRHIRLASTVTAIGDYAFQNCVNAERVTFGYSVTRIGTSAFSGCAALTSVQMPASVTVLGESAFSDCTSLTSLTLPDLTEIGARAFYHCTQLQSAALGGKVKKIGELAFGACGALTGVYFRGGPLEEAGNEIFGQTGETGTVVYYYSSVSGWDDALENGIWYLGYRAFPLNALQQQGDVSAEKLYYIKVVNQDDMPIAGATVTINGTVRTTNGSGLVFLTRPENPVELAVAFDNGKEEFRYTDTAYRPSKTQMLDIIVLSGSVQGVSCNGESIASSVCVLNCAENATTTIVVAGNTDKTIVKYELVQGRKLLSAIETSEPSCKFTIPARSFSEGQPVIVKLYTSDGSAVASGLNIDVLSIAEISQSSLINEMSSMEMTVQFGSLGTCRIPVDLRSDQNTEISSYREDRTIRVGINLDVGKIAGSFQSGSGGSLKSYLEKKVNETISLKNVLESNLTGGFKFKICGYIDIDYLGNGRYQVKTSYVKLAFTAKLSFKAEASYYGLVGVYFNASLTADASLALTISRYSPEMGLTVNNATLALQDKLEIEAGVYILFHFGEASVYGNVTLGFDVKLHPDRPTIQRVFMNGEIGVRWSLIWGAISGSEVIARGNFYNWSRQLSTDLLQDAYHSPDSYSVHDRAYLANRSAWQPKTDGARAVTGEGDPYTDLQTGAYENLSPRLVSAGNDIVMLWLDDSASRGIDDFQTLCYAVYDPDAGAWSEPRQLDQNDTFDCEFDVLSDGSRIYVVYTEQKTAVSGLETLDLTDAAAVARFVNGTEVAFSTFEDGAFTAPVYLTDNDVCEILPSLSLKNNTLTATWIVSDNLGLTDSGHKDAVCCAEYRDGVWGAPSLLADEQNPLFAALSGELSGKSVAVRLVDSDADPATSGDRALILTQADGTSTVLNVGALSRPAFASVCGKDALVWCSEGSICCLTDVHGSVVQPLGDAGFFVSDYQIAEIGARTLFTFTAQAADDASGTDIFAVWLSADGTASAPIRLTETAGYVQHYDVLPVAGELLITFVETRTVESDAGQAATISDFRSLRYSFADEIALLSVDFDADAVAGGEAVDFIARIRNDGSSHVAAVDILLCDSTDTVLDSCTVAADLSCGSTAVVPFRLNAPAELAGDYQIKTFVSGTAADKTPSDNALAVAFAAADLSVEVEQKLINGRNQLLILVSNAGPKETDAALNLYAGDTDGRLLETYQIPALNVGESIQFAVQLSGLIDETDEQIACTVSSSIPDLYSTNNSETVKIFRIDAESYLEAEENPVENPLLSAASAAYDKYSDDTLSVDIEVGKESFARINGLTNGTDYRFENGTVTLLRRYLAGLDGRVLLEFVFDYADRGLLVRTFELWVSDSTPVALSGSVTIDGDPVVGGTVSANLAMITPDGAVYDLVWLLDGAEVCTENAYTIPTTAAGKTLTLQVTGREGYCETLTADVVITLRTQTAPPAPILNVLTSSSLSVLPVSGVEYSLDGTLWTAEGSFTALLPNCEYTVFARYAATALANASDSSSITVRTPKNTGTLAVSPAVVRVDYTEIELVGLEGYEYRCGSGSWQSSPAFTDLEQATEYVFYQRIAETDTNYAGEESAALHVTTLAHVTGIGLSSEEATVYNGDGVFELSAYLLPATAANQNVLWSSSDETIASVTEGIVTLHKPGVVTITVTSVDGGMEAACTLTVLCSHLSIQKVEAVPSTCIDHGNGTYTLCLDCGEIVEGTDAPLPYGKHAFAELPTPDALLSAATCISPTNYYRSCTVCGVLDTETFTDGEPDSENHVGETHISGAAAPTCTAAGYTGDTVCGSCGATLESGSVIEQLPHTPGEKVEENRLAPTCTEVGGYDTVVYCTDCRTELSREHTEIAALGHAWGEPTYTWAEDYTKVTATRVCANDDSHAETETVNTSAWISAYPTCTNAGMTTYDACFENTAFTRQSKTVENIEALGHTPGEPVEENRLEPTCTEIGGYDSVIRCSACGEELSRVHTDLASLGHDWNDGVIDPAPNCTDEGVKTFTCRRCGEAWTEPVSALGHTPGETAKENETAPTCTIAGGYDLVTRCTTCNAVLNSEHVEIPALGHTPGEPVEENRVEPACMLIGGYDTATYCAVCGTELSRVHTDLAALGHDWDDGVIEDAPSCTAEGVRTYTCLCCGEKKTEAISETGHFPGEPAEENRIEPRCTLVGSYDMVVRCAVCDAILSSEHVELPALGHTPGEQVNENETVPSCETVGGFDTATYCTVCGAELSREHTEIAALGHDWGEPNYVWADDYSSVTATRTCKNDTSHVETETVKTTSKVTKEATYTAEGEITYTAVFTNAAFKTQTKAVATPKLIKPVLDNPFTDVKSDAFYYDAVLWAVNANPQVTSGTSATTFSPNATCTRAQVVTFLWRAKGCPEPKTNNNPFNDVKAGDYYYKAVLWAVENGITAGTSATTFSPNAGCTRAQVVTFLWRTEGQPKPTSSANPFTDVKGGYYYDAVLWAVEKGITAGTSATTFSPDATCTRGQIVTFLYRAFAA